MEKTKTSYAGSLGSFRTRTTQHLNPSTPQPLPIIPSAYHKHLSYHHSKQIGSLKSHPTNLPISEPLKPSASHPIHLNPSTCLPIHLNPSASHSTNLPINRPLNSSTPQPLLLPLAFPLKQSLHRTLSHNLNRLHSNSQNLYHSRLIAPLLSFSRSKSLIQYKDILFSIAPSIHTKLYPLNTSIRKIAQLAEYYRYHKDIPKMLISPVNSPVFTYYDSQRRLAYETLSNKLYFSKSYRPIDKAPAKPYEKILPQKPDFGDNLSMVTIRELREALSTPLSIKQAAVQYQSDHNTTKRDLFTRKHHTEIVQNTEKHTDHTQNRENDRENHIDNRDHRGDHRENRDHRECSADCKGFGGGGRDSAVEKVGNGMCENDIRDYCHRFRKQKSGKLLSTIDDSTRQSIVNLFLKNRLKSIDKAAEADYKPAIECKQLEGEKASQRENGYICEAGKGVGLGPKESVPKAELATRAGRAGPTAPESLGGNRETQRAKNQKKPGVFLDSKPKIYQSLPQNAINPSRKPRRCNVLFSPSIAPLESHRALSNFKFSMTSHRPIREPGRPKTNVFCKANPLMSALGLPLSSESKRPASKNQPNFGGLHRANSFGKSHVLTLSKRSSVY